MRPLCLKMSAFGPYPGTEIIDFSALGKNPLFLINGATGSGKTTILDAICFALYGKTTGDEREAAQMRCDLAHSEQLCEVSYDFILNDRHFRIRRLPEQQRPKNRGDGFTEQKPEAQLTEFLPDGTEKLHVSSKVSEANREIEELTGLSVDQFRQVMILPQGQFRQLLLAESSEREKIFSRLFQTHIYKNLEDRLKEQSANIRRERERCQLLQAGILEGAEVESVAELETEMLQLQPEVEAALSLKRTSESALLTANNRLEQGRALMKDFEEFAAVETGLNQLAQRYEQIENDRVRFAHAQQAQKIQPHFTEKERCIKELEKTQRKIYEAENILKKAKVKLLETEQELQKAGQLTSDLDFQKRQLELIADSKTKLSRYLSLCRQRNDIEKNLEVYTLLSLAMEKAELLNKIGNLDSSEKELKTLQRQQENAETFGKQLKIDYEVQSRATKSLELKWHQGQASILAAELEENRPCPVCGSTDHPEPARCDSELPSYQVVEDSRVQLQAVSEKLETARDEFRDLRVLVQQKQSHCLELAQQLPEVSSSLVEEIRSEQKSIQQTLQNYPDVIVSDGKKLTREQLEKKLLADERALSALNVEIGLIEDQLPEQFRIAEELEVAENAVKAKIVKLEQRLETISGAHKKAHGEMEAATSSLGESKNTLKELTLQLTDAARILESALKDSPFPDEQQYQRALMTDTDFSELKNRIETFSEQRQKLIGAQEQLQKRLAGKVRPDLTGDEETLRLAEVQKTDHANRWMSLDSRKVALETTRKKLEATARQLTELDLRYAVVGTLSDVANGQTGRKISLQRFVLSALLDDVLMEASRRLISMSKGRYRLLRKEDRAKGNKASGLELLVDDAYTGKVRPVATLSGGESFMAALSLALGLSDIVQAYAGGIRLDTLFVDEGFGSLDPESLDLAVRTLIDLQSSGRMIGIISHVADLKEQVPLRIDVIGGRLGSSIRMSR